MPFDAPTAARLRGALGPQLLAHEPVEELKMFGGLAFMVGGHMTVGVVGDQVMARLHPDALAELMGAPGFSPMDFTGRPLKGFVFVGEPALSERLDEVVGRALRFTRGLPPKAPRAARAPRPPKAAR